MASLGKHIRRARLEQGLSQSVVAEKLKITQTTVSCWETDKSRPDELQMRKLVKLLGVVMPGRKSSRAPEESDAGDRTRAFGRWLERERERAGMSVLELSEKSGVSVPSIYNIESGRSANPRAATRERLQTALQIDIPSEIIETSAESSEIEGLGALTDFDPHDPEDRPTCGGVYVFYDISERPVYVGKAENIARRVKDHVEKFWFKAPIVNNAAYVEIKDKTLRHQVEQTLIRFLKSNAVINKQSVERSD